LGYSRTLAIGSSLKEFRRGPAATRSGSVRAAKRTTKRTREATRRNLATNKFSFDNSRSAKPRTVSPADYGRPIQGGSYAAQLTLNFSGTRRIEAGDVGKTALSRYGIGHAR
jgi:hypothetical protein